MEMRNQKSDRLLIPHFAIDRDRRVRANSRTEKAAGAGKLWIRQDSGAIASHVESIGYMDKVFGTDFGAEFAPLATIFINDNSASHELPPCSVSCGSFHGIQSLNSELGMNPDAAPFRNPQSAFGMDGLYYRFSNLR
jgi:hypothetical protein